MSNIIDIKARVLRKYDLDMAIRYVAEKTSALTVNDPMHIYYFKLTIEYMIEGGKDYHKSIEENFKNFFAFIAANNIEYPCIKQVIDMELDFYMSTGQIDKAIDANKRNKLFEL